MTREEKEIRFTEIAMEDPLYYIRELMEGLDDWYLNELLGINDELEEENEPTDTD